MRRAVAESLGGVRTQVSLNVLQGWHAQRAASRNAPDFQEKGQLWGALFPVVSDSEIPASFAELVWQPVGHASPTGYRKNNLFSGWKRKK